MLLSRGTTSQIASYAGPQGELIVDTDQNALVLQTGTAGGVYIGSGSGSTVSFTQSLTSGTKVGTLTIDGADTDLYCQTNTTYSAGTGLSLSGTTFSLGTSGVTSGSYGPSANASPAHSGTFSVPYITVDTYGRVTAAATKTITLPAASSGSGSTVSFTRSLSSGTKIGTLTIDGTDTDLYCQTNTDTNTDVNVTQTVTTTSSAYPILFKATTDTSTVTAGARFGAGVTINPSTKTITATTFSGDLSGNATTATSATKVTQTSSTTSSFYPLLASANTSPTSGTAYGAIYNTKVTLNPGSAAIYLKDSIPNIYMATNKESESSSATYTTNWGIAFGFSNMSTSVTSYTGHLGQVHCLQNAGGARRIGFYLNKQGSPSTIAQFYLEWTASNSKCNLVFAPQSTAGEFCSANDNKTTLGDSNLRWGTVYSGTATINTSDERLKTSIAAIPDEALDAWADVNWQQFQMLDSVEEKGIASARLHTGAIAQQIQSVFTKHGVDATRYGFFCYDAWDEKSAELDENGVVLQAAIPAGNRYSLRYTEALCLEAAYQRRRADRLEARIAALEAKLEAKLGE